MVIWSIFAEIVASYIWLFAAFYTTYSMLAPIKSLFSQFAEALSSLDMSALFQNGYFGPRGLIESGYLGKSYWLYGLLKTYYWLKGLLGLLDIRSYWLCGQFALDKTVDHITDPHCTCNE